MAEKALQLGHEASPASSGACSSSMNPQTGEILAMVALPTYDDNLFAERDQPQGLPGCSRTRQAAAQLSPSTSSTRPARRTSS